MSTRLITPSQLSLFSRSPLVGAWWEEVHALTPKQATRPKTKALDDLLYAAGLEHEKLLITELKLAGKSVEELRGEQE